MRQCWLDRKESRPTFTELGKEICTLLAREGQDLDEDLYSAYF